MLRRTHRVATAALAAAAALVIGRQLQATPLYWDANTGVNAGAGAAPTGTWGTSNFWNTDPTGLGAGAFQSTTLNSDNLFFVAGPAVGSGDAPYTVSVNGSQAASQLTFQASGDTTISGGTSITLGDGTAGNGGIQVPQFAFGATNNGAVAISTPITLNNSQTWANNSSSLLSTSGLFTLASNTLTVAGPGNITMSGQITGPGAIIVNTGVASVTNLSNTANDYAGGVQLLSGIVDMGINNATFGTGPVTFNGGTVRTSTGNRNVANSLIIDAGGLTFTGAQADNWNGPATVQNNPTLTFSDTGAKTFTNTLTLNSNFTISGSGSGTTAFNGGITIGGGVAGTNRTITMNRGTSLLTLAGSLAGTAASQTLTLVGTGTNNAIGNISSGTNAPNIIVNASPSAVFFFNNTSAAYTGTITLTSGIADLGLNLVPVFGNGTLVLNGGTIRNSLGARTVNGPLNLIFDTGGATFTNGASAQNTIFPNTVPVTVQNNPTINFTNNVAGFFFQGVTTLSTGMTVGGTHSQSANFTGGFDLGGATRTLTFNDIGTVNLSGAFSGTPGTLVLAGSSTGVNVGAMTTSSSAIQLNSTTGGTFTFNGASTFTGGLWLTSGTAVIAANQTITAGALVSSPVGIGAMNLSGGTLRTDGNARTLSTGATLSNTVTFGALTGSNTLTIDPTLVTSPSTPVDQVSGAATLIALGALNINGILAGTATPSLTVKGPASVTLTNNTGTTSSFGTNGIAVGDAVASGSLGANLTINGNSAVNQQNTIGSGDVTLNFGGTLFWNNAQTTPANRITVNNGGTMNFSGGGSVTTPNTFSTGTGSIINSGATITNQQGNSKQLVITSGAGAGQVTLPTSGVLLFGSNNNGGNTITLASGAAYPAFTGTMAFGGNLGTASGGSVTLGTLATPISADQTIAFNTVGTASSVLFTGLALSANLNIVGSGNSGFVGMTPTGSGGSLGTVTETAPHSITLNMSHIGVASVTRSASGWSGGTLVKGGTLSTDGGTTNQKMLGSAGITLDGGFVRNSNNANNDTTWQDAITLTANGGGIESFAATNSNFQNVTFTGAITGSAPLTLRYGGNTAGGGSGSAVILAPASPSSYSGPITLSTTTGRGRVQFNANALNSIAAAGISVPAGVSFGVDSLATLTGNISKFTTSTNSILVLDNLLSSNIDLSPAGLNRDIRIGGTGYRNAITYTGTLTPFGSTYNITPTDNQTVTFGTANQFTGSRNLDVRAGAVAPGAFGVAGGILSITAAQDYSGTTTVAGTVSNSLIGGSVLATSAVALGGLTATSSILVDNAGVLNLNAGVSGASAVPVVVRGGASLSIGGANTLNSTATLTLGGASGGGNYVSSAAAVQSIANLTIAAGRSSITPNATGALTLSDPAATVYTRTVGGVVNFANANTSFTNAPTGSSTSIGDTGDAILTGAVLNNADFVKANSGAIAAPAYNNNNAVNTWTNDNILVSAAATGSVVTGTINSLKQTAATQINITAANTLTVASGMIFYTGASAITGLAGGNITTSNPQGLTIMNAGGNLYTISSNITGNPVLTAVPNPRIQLSGSNALGDIYVVAAGFGTGQHLRADNDAAIAGTGTNLFLLGGSLNTTGALTLARNITVGAAGGGLLTEGNGSSITANGTLTLNGPLNFGSGNNNATANQVIINGSISGPGTIVALGNSNSNSRFTLAGTNSSWTGGIRLGDGHQIRLASASAAGTGPIVHTQNVGIIEFSGNADGPRTIPNDIIANTASSKTLIANAKTDPLTLSGNIFSVGGLTFQGYDSGSAVSQTILAGKLAVSGTPDVYSYGTATTAQRFVNAQGGLNLGVTDRQSTTQITALGTAGFLDMPTGVANANVQVTNGAEGYVRFGSPNSFIPGATGPGYIAAIRKSGSPAANFGYLLTGGSTYTLPEGKSFVIGSLGSGASVGGVLGSTGTGTNTAILEGSPKLAGFAAGDVNIHANAAGDSQSLSITAVNASDTLQLGTLAKPVVFTPTYGDSGFTNAITLMSKRTAATTLNKVGAGTLIVNNASYTHVDGAPARAGFTWNVNAGTLRYDQNDGASPNFAAFNVNSSATLAGTGTINSTVTVAGSATLAPGASPGTLTTGALSLANTSALAYELATPGTVGSGVNDLVTVNGALTLDGILNVTALGGFGIGTFRLFDYSGALTNNTLSLGTVPGGFNYAIDTATSGQVNLIVSSVGGPPTWNVDANGAWLTGSNWTGGSSPNAADAQAVLGSIITAPRTVTIGAPGATVGSLTINNASAYTVAGPGTLTLSKTGGASVTVTTGNHTISAPISLASDTTLTLGSNTLTASTIRGAKALSIASGTLKLADGAGTSKVAALTLAGGTVPTSTLDLGDNKLIIDYTGASVLPTVRAQVISGRNGYDANIITNWNGKGIVSTKARTESVIAGFDLFTIGLINNADLADGSIGRDTYTTFGGLATDDSSVLLRYTYSGDADLNGQVDGDDYALIDNAFNLLIPNFGWLAGDFNYDGNIDGDDYALIDSGFLFQGAPIPAASTSAVPEPATLGVLALASVGLLGKRKRRA